ncbi:putative gustatory receptor 36c [Haematobia irritans]|uniref:putative gustatory receptor 36c n=1 Tax=Haematobia irritans TaxID=7368 RepID=UPI003F500D75
MRRSTQWMIRANYYTSLVMGILSFVHDQETGEIYTTPFVTIYSTIASIGMFGHVPLLYYLEFNSPYLHVKINALLFVLRVLSLLVTVVTNWTKRQEFMDTLRDFRWTFDQYISQWPLSEKLEKKLDYTLRLKFHWGFVTWITLMLGTYEFFKMQFKLDKFFVILPMMIMSSLFNVVMTNYYLCMVHLNILLWGINDEVNQILTTSSYLWQSQKSHQIGQGILVTHCCKLSDDLDNLALMQHRIHLLGNRINNMYGIQGVSIMLMVYLNNMAVIYMTYTSLKYNQQVMEHFSTWSLLLIPFFLAFYYIDLGIFMLSMMNFQEAFVKTRELLRDRQPCSPILDERLEESFKNFSLQLAKFPVEMKLVGLFKFDRSMAFSIFGSTISNAIVLIQYDYKNNSNE